MRRKARMLHKKQIIRYILLTGCVLALCSCQVTQTVHSSKNESSMSDKYDAGKSDYEESTEDEEVLENTTYYQISISNSQYYCTFFDKSHQVVRVDGPYSKIPKVSVVNDSNPILLRLTIQTGTGIGTQYGYFYLVDEMKFSETFQSILDQSENLVAYIDKEKVVVRDIFDKTKYDKEISDFRDPFSNVAQPITNASFSEDSKTITVTYLTGENFREVSETFEI